MTDLPLTLLSESGTKITLGWTPVPGCTGYVFYKDGVRVSNSWDATKNQVTFTKGSTQTFRVDAVSTSASGSYPSVTPPPPPPPPPPAPTIVDARATRFTSWPDGGLAGEESPNIGTCAFMPGVMSIVANSTWGKVFSLDIDASDHNPWWNPNDGRSSGEYQAHDTLSPGDTRWWSQSIHWLAGDQYLPTNKGAGWFLVSQLLYLGIISPAIGIELRADGLALDRNGGVYDPAKYSTATDPAGYERTPAYRPLADFKSGWVDVMVGAKCSLDATGWIEFHSRIHGGSWTQHYRKTNTPVAQANSNGVFVPQCDHKCGGYNGSFVGYNAARRFQFELRGLSVHATRTDAEAALA